MIRQMALVMNSPVGIKQVCLITLKLALEEMVVWTPLTTPFLEVDLGCRPCIIMLNLWAKKDMVHLVAVGVPSNTFLFIR